MVLTGRGGYGNQSNKIAPISSPPPVQHLKSPKQTVRTGRGGFGNTISVDQVDFESKQQYIKEIDEMHQTPKKYYTGRGGAGNFVEVTGSSNSSVRSSPRSTRSSGSSVKSSSSSIMSLPTGGGGKLWNKLKTTVTR